MPEIVSDTVDLSFRLLCTLKKDGKRWVAGCPKLDIFSQGETEEQAKAALDEAIKLWLESCLDRRVLDEALRECGFRRVTAAEEARCDHVIALRPAAQQIDPGADTFDLTLTIPAYQAAAALAAH